MELAGKEILMEKIVGYRYGYEELLDILVLALDQSQFGKGKRRHSGATKSFTEQPILTITRVVGLGFPLGQALKKINEVTTASFSPEQVREELLGAIVYLAAAIIHSEDIHNDFS